MIMDETSPMRCYSFEDLVECECNDEALRYDVETSSCISSCESGKRWESVISNLYDMIISDVGRCVDCLAGTYSVASLDEWVETCSNCSAGEYVTTNGSSTCFSCPRGRFSTRNASIECEICTWCFDGIAYITHSCFEILHSCALRFEHRYVRSLHWRPRRGQCCVSTMSVRYVLIVQFHSRM